MASVAPVVARTAAGVYTITWAATYADELGVSHTVNLRYGHAHPVDNNNAMTWGKVAITSANVATLRTFDAAAAVALDTNVNLLVLCL